MEKKEKIKLKTRFESTINKQFDNQIKSNMNFQISEMPNDLKSLLSHDINLPLPFTNINEYKNEFITLFLNRIELKRSLNYLHLHYDEQVSIRAKLKHLKSIIDQYIDDFGYLQNDLQEFLNNINEFKSKLNEI